MTEPQSTALSLPARVGVINVGLSLFADAIRQQGAPVISVDWRVPAGGEPAAVAALSRLYGIHAERIEAANAEVLRRLDHSSPLLARVTTVARAVPGLVGRTLLHCGPAIGYANAPDPLRRSMRAAAVAEGWAASLEQAGPCWPGAKSGWPRPMPTGWWCRWRPRWEPAPRSTRW